MATWAETDPKVLLKYGREFTSASMELNWWNKFMNNDEGAVIMTDLRDETPNEEGGTVRVYFRDEIEGDGITGDQDFEDNEGTQATLYQDVDYGIFGIALKSKAKKLESKMATENFRSKMHKDQPRWLGKREDRIITAKFTEKATNIVACSAADGTYQANNTNSIKAVDKFSTAAIDEAKRRAQNGEDGDGNEHPIVEPFLVKTVSREGGITDYVEFYLLVIGANAEQQLREDPLWIEAQKMAQKRGSDNPIFTGAMGEYNGVIVFTRNNWSNKRAGIITSELGEYKTVVDGKTTTYASGFNDYRGDETETGSGVPTKTEINLFLGATAGLKPFDEGFDYYEEPLNGGRKLRIGCDRGTGFAKTKYNGTTTDDESSVYHGKDFGMIAIVNALEKQ
jgi:N4-gp56 family major capsid protein